MNKNSTDKNLPVIVDPVISQEIQEDIRTLRSPSLLAAMMNSVSPLSSPVPEMSPETQQLFHIFTEHEATNEDNDVSNHVDVIDYCDSDDSVRDPDYVSNNNGIYIDETTTSCSSLNDNESHEKLTEVILPTADIPRFSETSRLNRGSNRQFQVTSKLPERRCSENDLQLMQPPAKILKRRASVSGAIFSIIKSSSPKKKHVSNPNTWKRHIERKKRLRGKAYKTIKGKYVAAATLKQPKCLTKDKHKCNANVPEDARKIIYDSFRAMESLQAQRQFIIQHVTKENKKRSTVNGPSRKVSTHQYCFTVNNRKVTVCRDFFLDTLNIKEGIVRGALKKISKEGVLLADKRGKKPPSNKLSSERLDRIKNHIFSFPTMDSHYCRKNSEFRYLDSGLNVTIMYSLYKKKCEDEGEIPAGIETYRKVFRSYKLKFHVPKKDLCKKCVAYKELKTHDLSSPEEENHSKHLKRRDDAYLRRDADKTAAKNDPKTLAFNFDLQAVLQTPKGASGPFFYVRKLAVYNLTFYKFGDQDVDCFTWDETEGKRGSTEIATCVFKYICSKQGVTHVRMMSDNCGGQQKNYNFCCMLLHLVTSHSTVNIIDHVFYESGHSHMECDSIHSKIEQKCKNTAIYTPDGWIQVMRLARTNPRPFNVNVLVHDDFLDFNPNQCQFVEAKEQSSKRKNKVKRNNEQEDNGALEETRPKVKINFQDAVWIQYRKDNPKSIFIKTDYNDETFKEFNIKPKRGKSTCIVPKNIYTERMPISKQKKRDLLKLCTDNQIPKYYHSFYKNLPDSEAIEDRLPEPDVEEDEKL
ncbi:uncharacterized protein LOC111362667 [Spodoptera litura]|uniref:Uncharacterized protein LOC111362667 n=1 Tax=Spodoptera litura TaxID=69820 RepID=A0A9J7EP47_SPOLT|nr:uncharacterized protein LOC111362667 [Spodoptera litura]XP_022835162.1 uncharacterized protein LOC111362667 [Spodoptera litura]